MALRANHGCFSQVGVRLLRHTVVSRATDRSCARRAESGGVVLIDLHLVPLLVAMAAEKAGLLAATDRRGDLRPLGQMHCGSQARCDPAPPAAQARLSQALQFAHTIREVSGSVGRPHRRADRRSLTAAGSRASDRWGFGILAMAQAENMTTGSPVAPLPRHLPFRKPSRTSLRAGPQSTSMSNFCSA